MVINNGHEFWNIPEDSGMGYFLEVDLDYLKNLHDKHNNLPFFPESRAAPGSKQKNIDDNVIQQRVICSSLSSPSIGNKASISIEKDSSI